MSTDVSAIGKTTANGKTTKAEKGPIPVFEPTEFVALGSRNLEAATRAAHAYFNGAAQLNQQFMGFINNRLKKDIESAQTLMTSKTSEEALKAQAGFFEEAFRDYADEASKVLNLAADLTKKTILNTDQYTHE